MSTYTAQEKALFTYSSGRFLYNEEARLRERKVPFDVDALKGVLRRHVDHGEVSRLEKLSEGGYNRILLATMEDGFRAIVKIPYWISVPKTHATASEVATLSFLRSKDIPVPQVYGWSATTENPVGVEYIIMEHAPGVGADTCWFDESTNRQKHALVTGIVDIEKRLFEIPFAATGSLYFKADLPKSLQKELYAPGTPDEQGDSKTYCIGPTVDYMFWYGKRADLEINRGPWTDAKGYLLAVAQKEIEWVKRFGKPLECDFPHNTLFPGVNSHEDYLVLQQKYLEIAPYLLPSNPQDPLNKPTLRHPDLTPSNVFICPESHKVKCVIDWQHTEIKPLALTSGYPKLFENPDSEMPDKLEAPKLPEGYESMDAKAKANADELMRRQQLFYYYRVFNGGLNKLHLTALREPFFLPRQHLVDTAGRQWSGNLMTLRCALMHTSTVWDYVPGKTEKPDCPISFPGEDLVKQTEDEKLWCTLNALVSQWRDELGGMSEEGWVREEVFAQATERNQSLQVEFAKDGSEDELAKLSRGWPFQNREEFF